MDNIVNKSTFISDSEQDDDNDPPIKQSTLTVNLSPTTDGDPSSAENTPTTYTHRQSSFPPDIPLLQWTPNDCADYAGSLGLGQYADMLIDEAINGEALIEVHHEDLKDIGVTSLGHRLTILKGVYEMKMSQNIPLDPDHYVPLSAEENPVDMSASQDDIARVIESIRLRDQRIIATESELRALKDDLNRIMDENRKLREETLPLIRLAKDKSHPLPNPEAPLTTPPPDLKSMQASGSGLSRKFSTKRLFLGSAPKNTSPTTLMETGTPEPGSAAMPSSGNFLSTSSQYSPNNNNPQLSPTSPAYSTNTTAIFNGPPTSNSGSRFGGSTTARDDTSSYYGMGATYHPTSATANPLRGRDVEPPLGSAPLPSSATSMHSMMPMSGSSINSSSRDNRDREREQRERDRDRERRTQQSQAPNVNSSSSNRDRDRDRDRDGGGGGGGSDIEIFKSFRVSIQDPCREVLPIALKRYNINEDWRQYALYIVHGDQERCLGLDEKPLMLFKQLDREGRKPMFMLRKHASPAVGWSSENGGGNKTMSRDLPGGVL